MLHMTCVEGFILSLKGKKGWIMVALQGRISM